ncbi:MAG TPA: 4-aminobutyrate--2-oxoglutarate transaminase [Vicinamibacteria bacterium]|nr:4-aminobutyrate--2-oxoglutarate transaminase [Vicinamibacteria bacterium]
MKGEALIERREAAVARGLATAHPIFAERARGIRLRDVDGREYLDFTGGIGVLNVGHLHPRVVAAVTEQLEHFSHTCFQVAMYEGYVALAERLNDLVPGDSPKKTILLTTGVEAIENAIKMARVFTGRPASISFTHSFHGRTLLGMTLTGKTGVYKQSFGPFAPEVYHTPYPYPYRGWTTERALEALGDLFRTVVAPDRVAAIVIEPVLGEGGFVAASPDFLRALRRVADERGMLLIADEIQCGMGRTGRMFAVEHADVVPDLVCLAKSLGGGFPLSAVVGRAEVADAPVEGGLGGTYGGNPVACAAALAVLDIFESERLLDRAYAQGELLRDRLDVLAARLPRIGEVRGLGSMLGLEIVEDAATRQPSPARTRRIVEVARERGLLLLRAGTHDNVIRLLPPLVATEEELERGIEILTTAVDDALGGEA